MLVLSLSQLLPFPAVAQGLHQGPQRFVRLLPRYAPQNAVASGGLNIDNMPLENSVPKQDSSPQKRPRDVTAAHTCSISPSKPRSAIQPTASHSTGTATTKDASQLSQVRQPPRSSFTVPCLMFLSPFTPWPTRSARWSRHAARWPSTAFRCGHTPRPAPHPAPDTAPSAKNR